MDLRARSFDEQFQGEHKITVLVRRIAHELTNLSKTLWPGSVQALQMNAVPACVVTELGLKTLHAPKTWAEAHEFVQNHRERAMTSEVPVDDYGWADRPRKAPPGQPRALLREAQRAVEAIAGNVTDPPPRHLTTPPEELPNEQLDALVKHAQALRDIRRFIAAEDPETWGAVMGRLRWLAGRLGERLPQLRRWLDPEFIPPPERAKTGPSADQVRQQQATVRAERDALVAADSFDDEALLAFLGRAFDAHNTPEVASLVQPIRPRIDALRPDLFEDRRMRRRLTGLQDVIKRGELGVLPSDSDSELEEETDDVDDPGAHLVAQVRPKVEGKRVLFVSNREDPDLKSKLEESLGLDITWCDGNARKVQAQCESISRHSYDYVLIATGFQAHNIDGILARAARASAIPYVRVFKGRPSQSPAPSPAPSASPPPPESRALSIRTCPQGHVLVYVLADMRGRRPCLSGARVSSRSSASRRERRARPRCPALDRARSRTWSRSVWSPPQRSGARASSRIAPDRRQRLQARCSATFWPVMSSQLDIVSVSRIFDIMSSRAVTGEARLSASFEEKSVWIQLIGVAFALGAYFVVAGWMLARGITILPAFAGVFVVAVVLLVALLVGGHLVAALVGRPEPADVRDREIEGRAESRTGWILATGVIGAIGALVVAVEPVWVAHLLLLSLYLSELARLALQLVYYRRGM
ncbi:hypothetical protein [Nannocystis pusilla]|uniref:hypothetical protein n=1 Tax=Nannocystis pusilla TaxID=889268 RepID=UPI003B79BA90